MNSTTSSDSNKHKSHKRDSKKAKLIRSIFEIDEDKILEPPKKKNIIRINYDKNIYFQNQENSNKKDLENIISNVLKNPNPTLINNENDLRKINLNKNDKNENNNKIINEKNIFKEKAINALSEYKLKNENKGNNFRTSSINNTPLKTQQRKINFQKPEKINFENSNNHFIEKSIPKPAKPDDNNILMSIPCMNCGNLISFDKIENHSLTCIKVSEEIMKTESSNYELYSIDYKLKKLKEHLSSILINNKGINDTEIQFLSTILLEYIKEVIQLQKIDIPTIKEFKKVIKNLENISIKYKDNISDLILIDRTKLLVNEKLKIFKNAYKNEMNSRKSNNNKSGQLKYEEDLKLKIQQLEKINKEKEFEKTKVKNLRKSAGPANRPKILNRNFSNSIISEKKNEDSNSIFSDKENNNYIKVNEIVSDVENNSNILSVNTSMSNISGYEGSFLGNTHNNYSNFKVNNDNVLLNDLKDENKYNRYEINNLNNNNNILINNDNINGNYTYNGDEKKDKKQFFMEVLKIKFEKLHSTHKGQKINQKFIWEECKKQNIPKDNWPQFILGELNNPYKYIEIEKKEKRSKSRKTPMAVITEEK